MCLEVRAGGQIAYVLVQYRKILLADVEPQVGLHRVSSSEAPVGRTHGIWVGITVSGANFRSEARFALCGEFPGTHVSLLISRT